MLIISLILLLLSNSTSFLRDKSILYTRTTITILVIAIIISYDNLYFLFLNKGIRIFGGLFHSTSTTAVLHLFILSMITLIIALILFIPESLLRLAKVLALTFFNL